MRIVDRSSLRRATCGMRYVDDGPTSVTINEAVELAKDFGGEDESHRFVNGVLGRIAKMLEGEADPAVPSPTPCAVDEASGPEAPCAAQDGGAASDCESAHGA